MVREGPIAALASSGSSRGSTLHVTPAGPYGGSCSCVAACVSIDLRRRRRRMRDVANVRARSRAYPSSGQHHIGTMQCALALMTLWLHPLATMPWHTSRRRRGPNETTRRLPKRSRSGCRLVSSTVAAYRAKRGARDEPARENAARLARILHPASAGARASPGGPDCGDHDQSIVRSGARAAELTRNVRHATMTVEEIPFRDACTWP